MSLTTRQASSSDLAVVRQISAEAYIPAYLAAIGVVPKPAVEDYRPRIQRGEVWLLEAEDDPVGLIVLEEGPEYLTVYSIAVRPARQGRGHAQRLLKFAEQQAAAKAARELRLYTNTRMERNITLYRRFGFIAIGTRPHPSRAGQTLVDMVKPVPNQPAYPSKAG